MDTPELNPAPADTPAAPDTAPTDLTAGAVAALDAGLATEKPDEPKPAEPVAADPAKPADAPAGKPAEPAADDEPPPGLSDKAQARFKELTPYKAAFKQAGIERPEDLPAIVERARFADELEQAIVSTGATPEQYGSAIQYLALVNSGDPDKMAQAFDVMQAELAALSKALGREVPGVHDPLADHPDLQEEVQAGDITKKRALEIVQQRNASSLTKGRQEQASAQEQARQEHAQAIDSLNQLGAQLKAADPQYAAKIAALKPTIALIRETFPPAQWAARLQAAYQQVNVPAAPAAPTLPPPGPVRSVAPAGVTMAAEPKSPMEALDLALAAAARSR
jgi:hypothetical protein